jgi:hypothetical protein
MSLKDLISKLRVAKLPSYGESVHPVRDWFVIVAIALLLLVTSVGWNMWLFSRAIEGEAIGETPAPTDTYDLSSLETVRSLFERRQAEEMRYRNDYRFIDPAL